MNMLNKPTYLLICLIEECAEIIQRVCKAIRFGMDEIQPGQDRNNYDRLKAEVADFHGVARMLAIEGDIDITDVDEMAVLEKIDKVHQFMPLSQDRRMLETEDDY